MKTLARTLMAFVLLSGVVAAQTANPTPAPEQTTTNAVMNKLKDPATAKELSQALAVLQDVANTQPADPNHKTVGDALNKGLDMAKDTVVYLAVKIEQVAPQLWKVLIVQQYVKGATGLINPVGFLLLIVIFRRLVLKWWVLTEQQQKEDWWESSDLTARAVHGVVASVLPLICIVIGVIWFYSSITDAVGYFVNPNYYAIHDIITMVRNPAAF